MKRNRLIVLLFVAVLLSACSQKAKKLSVIDENLAYASAQIGLQLKSIEEQGKILNPRTINPKGITKYVQMEDWTSGFFPGIMWYMFEMTGDERWKDYGIKLIPLNILPGIMM